MTEELITMYPSLAYSIDDIVFAIGYEAEIEEKKRQQKFDASLHDKKLTGS